MQRREFIKLMSLSAGLPLLSGCGILRVDPWSVFLRSDIIRTPEDEQAILQKARLDYTEDGRVRVLYTRGTPYERGYQHGALLRQEVSDNIGYLYDQARNKFRLEELFAESYERMRPFISQEYVEEMHGLAHGSRLPLHVIHGIHALPEIGEWGGKKRIQKVVKEMMAGNLGTSCSNLCIWDSPEDAFLSVRILDWGLHRISRLHRFPLIHVSEHESGMIAANIGWIGFLGAVSGMNEQGITLGEMGYGDKPNETLAGKPMPFLLRDILSFAHNLRDVRDIIQGSPGTNSFVYLMTDGKARQAEIYLRDRDRFVVYEQNQEILDGNTKVPPIDKTLYGGHYIDRMTEMLTQYKGKITVELLQKKIIPYIAMPSNFQNVVYDAQNLRFWVANARGQQWRAADEEYTYFDLRAAIAMMRQS
jgi:isopenicillin-N N-acyltransferase like protein